ncbi:GrxA family glutaredoxin [Exilibacterium tricleocarpae]|uniref:GrxA family glutaredoxin n=1 Tax=Exilibacterium tricleocarpae TaxID=2591008 RepID=A0A545TVQ2_9GAMM|nr:GrxA family glutaredoxin [Exilibacterium tricleocarpae]TQV81282.1 GrxA family glutaredoxin [Exilibacterium tricleocarpae]
MAQYTIFGRQGCGFCVQAQAILDQRQLPYRYVDIHKAGISREDLATTIGREVKTVPQIFHGQTYIGGFTDLREHLSAA